jgi:lipopolysaccharide export system protein LptA
MKKILITFFAIINFLFAENLEILSDNFEADEKSGISVFSGNVKLNKGDDKLYTDKLVVIFNEKRVPVKYEAIGNSILIYNSENAVNVAKAQKISYTPKEKKYVLTGEAILEDKLSNKRIYGDKIYINESTGKAKIIGRDDDPVRFIFSLDDKEE